MGLMGLSGRLPVAEGADRCLENERTPIPCPGADMIIREAMRDDPRPLFIGMQGAVTDLASAILMEPRICQRMTCIWIGGGNYPEGGDEFNLAGDVHGANVLFSSSMPLWQVPRGTYKQFCVSLSELQRRVMPCGEIRKYLFEQMVELNDRMSGNAAWPHGETWCLGDEGVVCVLLQDAQLTGSYVMHPAPHVREDLFYEPGADTRPVRVYERMDVRMDLEDLFAKLALNFGE